MTTDNIPRHIAIIMDGNGRWAADKGLPRTAGHKKGAEAIPEIIQEAMDMGIKYITLFAFSSENWNRPKEEVDYLISLMREYLSTQFKELTKKNVKVRVIGDISKFAEDLQEKIKEVEEISKDKDGITVSLAVSYGGKGDILHACKGLAQKVKDGQMDIDDINVDSFSDNLYSRNLPDIDIMIRTGGEYRISNFLLWQVAYGELFFAQKYWPDFKKEDIRDIVSEYHTRNRRFGKVK